MQRPRSQPTRQELSLTCSECGTRNYKKSKPIREGQAPLKLRKFCKACNQHTMHVEAV